MTSFVQGYYRVSESIMRFAYVNLLWFVFTFLGLGIFGFMPATTAMFAVLRKWNRHEDDIRILPLFWATYKKDFVRSNVIGVFLFGTGYFLTIALHILRSSDLTMYYLASYGVVALMLLYSIVIIYFFPIFVHFNLKVSDYIKWPFIIGIIHPILTVVLIGGLGILLYATYSVMPALLLFFGGSVPAYLLMKGVSQTFARYEQIIE